MRVSRFFGAVFAALLVVSTALPASADYAGSVSKEDVKDVFKAPGYSPYAVAEHCVGLILALNRQIHRAYNRVREGNFSLSGMLGFDLHGRTVGIVAQNTSSASSVMFASFLFS